MNKRGAGFDRAGSRQDYATPVEFIEAVKAAFGVRFTWDLAAHEANAVVPDFLSPEQDALTIPWHKLPGDLWLNPPFRNITPWAAKCAEEAALGAKIWLLVPASVGANWWLDHVHRKADVYLLRGRLSFDGKAPFPKDCALCSFTKCSTSYREFDWRRGIVR